MISIDGNLETTFSTLVCEVEAKDPHTVGHSVRVMGYSVAVGEALGLSRADLSTLRMGALIHDLGKIGIPDEILTKPQGLTVEEYTIIKEHPRIGARMIEHLPVLKPCVPIVLHHHERLDGTGYPFGLKGDEISLLVRIVSAGDALDAMTSARAYRDDQGLASALEELRNDAELGRLDSNVVRILTEIVDKEGLQPRAA